MAWTPDICIYHSPCQDGFTAAWAIWKRWPHCVFVPGVYGQSPGVDLTGKRVLLVDFSYKRAELEALAQHAAQVVVLDHHKTAAAELAPFTVVDRFDANDAEDRLGSLDPRIWAIFDMQKSGARLAWDFAHPATPAPDLVRHVEDRDLWRFALPDTREIAADLFSRPYDFTAWDFYADTLATEGGRAHIVACGEAIERKHHKDVAELVEITRRWMTIGGEHVPVANLPYTMASDAAHLLADQAPQAAFGACYFDDRDGVRRFSLRSTAAGADVSLVAARYGGGGHARAAGFQAQRGWEGDDDGRGHDLEADARGAG